MIIAESECSASNAKCPWWSSPLHQVNLLLATSCYSCPIRLDAAAGYVLLQLLDMPSSPVISSTLKSWSSVLDRRYVDGSISTPDATRLMEIFGRDGTVSHIHEEEGIIYGQNQLKRYLGGEICDIYTLRQVVR